MNTNQDTKSRGGQWAPEIHPVPAAPNAGRHEPSTNAALVFPFIRALFLLAVAILLVLVVFGKLHDRPAAITRTPAPEPPSVDKSELAVNQAVTHLIARRLESGGLRDRVHLNPEMGASDSVNAFRHCLSLYALCHSVNNENRQQIVAELSPLARWILENALTPVDGRSDMHGLRSPSGKESGDLTLRLSAMGLVALSETHQLGPDIVAIDDLKKLGRFVAFMQRRDGGFYDACRIDKGNEVQVGGDDWSEANLAGLACLSLLKLHEVDADPQWLETAEIGIRHVVDGMRGKDSFDTDDWFPVAVRSFAPHVDEIEGGIRLADLEDSCRKMATGIVSKNSDLWTGSAEAIETREIARSTRALSSLLAVLDSPEDERLRQGLRNHVNHGIAFLAANQIKDGAQLGGFSRSGGTGLGHSKSRAGEVRIDYASYSLLALDHYLRSSAK